MALSILNVAYPLATVGPHAVGGAEQIVALLDRALTGAGHHSIVVACEGSQCVGTFVPVPRVAGMLHDHRQPAAQAHCRKAVAAALDEWAVDVVHLHGIDFHSYLPPPGVPTLVTLHLPPSFYAPEAFTFNRPETYLHCVSASQRRTCPRDLSLLPEINNGVPIDDLSGDQTKGRYVVSLGRICWEKGFHFALEAAAKAEIPMVLAGRVFPYAEHERYFREQIRPRLDRARRFIGPVGFERKRRLLAGAQALLVPSLVPETASLVAMEALACGTPVIAFRSGALVDVVEPGVTGFLVDSAAEMAAAIPRATQLSPEACRAAARTRFSAGRMLNRYLAVYQQLAASTGLGVEQEREGSYAA